MLILGTLGSTKMVSKDYDPYQHDIVWTYNYFRRIKTLDSCGEFPNVPILGSKGGISYNSVLARRHFVYPMNKSQGIFFSELFSSRKTHTTKISEKRLLMLGIQV